MEDPHRGRSGARCRRHAHRVRRPAHAAGVPRITSEARAQDDVMNHAVNLTDDASRYDFNAAVSKVPENGVVLAQYPEFNTFFVQSVKAAFAPTLGKSLVDAASPTSRLAPPATRRSPAPRCAPNSRRPPRPRPTPSLTPPAPLPPRTTRTAWTASPPARRSSRSRPRTRPAPSTPSTWPARLTGLPSTTST